MSYWMIPRKKGSRERGRGGGLGSGVTTSSASETISKHTNFVTADIIRMNFVCYKNLKTQSVSGGNH